MSRASSRFLSLTSEYSIIMVAFQFVPVGSIGLYALYGEVRPYRQSALANNTVLLNRNFRIAHPVGAGLTARLTARSPIHTRAHPPPGGARSSPRLRKVAFMIACDG